MENHVGNILGEGASWAGTLTPDRWEEYPDSTSEEDENAE